MWGPRLPQARKSGRPRGESPAFFVEYALDGALHLACLEARGAHVDPLGGTCNHGTNALDVRVPATLGAAVRVRDGVTEGRSLAADVAVGSHDSSPWCLCASTGTAERHIYEPGVFGQPH